MKTDFETIKYEETNGVAWVTLNRPEALNSFNDQMQRELRGLWHDLRYHDDVRCVVLTGAGDKAFCTGIDRKETMEQGVAYTKGERATGWLSSPWMFDDPGDNVGPKSCRLWKPVIAAVNGMACGGAFYMLGEVEFIIAADHASFFDPHVTYGMTAAYEPIHMMSKVPFPEIMRMTLLGNSERLSAKRAFEIGMVTQVVPKDELREAAQWVAQRIADAPPVAVVGSMRALWAAYEMGHHNAISISDVLTRLGNEPSALEAGQEKFASGTREPWRLR
jgi:enoyl-CoA hydratase/carnithine racemase